MFRPQARRVSAISCTANGLAVVRAPIHSISIPALRAACTWAAVATSVAASIPQLRAARIIQGSAFSPYPSNPPGLVRGFHAPARSTRTPVSRRAMAVNIICSSLSALHGPAMIMGRREWAPSGSSMGSSVISRCRLH